MKKWNVENGRNRRNSLTFQAFSVIMLYRDLADDAVICGEKVTIIKKLSTETDFIIKGGLLHLEY